MQPLCSKASVPPPSIKEVVKPARVEISIGFVAGRPMHGTVEEMVIVLMTANLAVSMDRMAEMTA